MDMLFESNLPTDMILLHLKQALSLDSQLQSDVMLYCKNGEIPCYRLVLASASPLLYSLLLEHSYRDSISILLPDFTTQEINASLHKFLQMTHKQEKHEIKNSSFDDLKTENASDAEEYDNGDGDYEPFNGDDDDDIHSDYEEEGDPVCVPIKLDKKPKVGRPAKRGEWALKNFTKLKSEDERYECKICGYNFVAKKTLHQTISCMTYHLQVKHGNEEFECSICHKKYPRKNKANRCERIHKQIKNYHCHECGKAFNCNQLLTKHLRIHSNEKPFQCTECGKNFSQEANLKIHMNGHTGERPYKCQFDGCTEAFHNQSSLKRHGMKHTGAPRFMCSECGKDFPTKQNMKNHQVVHTGATPYECDRCHQKFRYAQQRYKHKQTCLVNNI